MTEKTKEKPIKSGAKEKKEGKLMTNKMTEKTTEKPPKSGTKVEYCFHCKRDVELEYIPDFTCYSCPFCGLVLWSKMDLKE